MRDQLEVFRKMLDERNWPVRPDDVVLVEGEVYEFVSDDPLEECVRKALFAGKLQ